MRTSAAHWPAWICWSQPNYSARVFFAAHEGTCVALVSSVRNLQTTLPQKGAKPSTVENVNTTSIMDRKFKPSNGYPEVARRAPGRRPELAPRCPRPPADAASGSSAAGAPLRSGIAHAVKCQTAKISNFAYRHVTERDISRCPHAKLPKCLFTNTT